MNPSLTPDAATQSRSTDLPLELQSPAGDGVSGTTRATLAQQTQELRRNLQTPLPSMRIALERRIQLHFPHFQGFLTEYSSNISMTGMFVQSQEPKPEGTILEFEFTLSDGLKLIRGVGEVVWIRRVETGPDRPAGMGIRFLRLDAESRRLIRWAVEKQLHQGGRLFDVAVPPIEGYAAPADAPKQTDNAGTQAPEAPSAREKPAPMASSERPANHRGSDVDRGRLYPYAGYAKARTSGLRERLAVAAGVLPIALLLAALYVSSNLDQAAVPAGPAPAQSATTQSSATQLPESAASPAPPSLAGQPESGEQELITATEGWAAAWASQQPDDYLANYSPRFQPPGSTSRERWEAERSARISRPSFITVGISHLEVEVLRPDHGRVTFTQSYSSDSYRDEMRKTLELTKEDGRWRIVSERAA